MDKRIVLAESLPRLSDKGIHPTIRRLATDLVSKSFDIGIPIIIVQGFRSMAYQNGLYSQGRDKWGNIVDRSKIVTNASAGHSYHNYGLAVDFALLLSDGRTISWDTCRDGNRDGLRDWYEVAQIGEQLGFEWGGRWDGFVDMPHLQYPFGLTINQLLNGAKPPTGDVIVMPPEQPTVPTWKQNGFDFMVKNMGIDPTVWTPDKPLDMGTLGIILSRLPEFKSQQ